MKNSSRTVYFYTGYLLINDIILNIAPEYRRESDTQSAGSFSFPTSPKNQSYLIFYTFSKHA